MTWTQIVRKELNIQYKLMAQVLCELRNKAIMTAETGATLNK